MTSTLKILKYETSFLKSLVSVYFLLGFLAFGIRFYFNFAQKLIPGVNGGYYPLQVRSVLTNGHLGFPDMPFLFYFDAFLVKFIALFGFPITDNLIMNVVKIIDALSIPLILIPLYKIMRLEVNKSSKLFEVSIISFTILSFSPLTLTSDLQKNALAITFLLCFMAYLLSYLIKKKKSDLILSIAFLIITGLTHFGTFAITLLFLVLILGYTFKRKAIIPLSIVIVLGLFLVSIFDISRFNRLISFVPLIFERPALLSGMLAPIDYLFTLISFVLAVVGIIFLKTKKRQLLSYQKAVLFSCIVCLLALSFPLIDVEYFRRFSLFLFIPQILLLIQISSILSDSQLKKISISLFILTLFSILSVVRHPKETVINHNTYVELKKLKPIIGDDDESIIIARHGLEWWTAWALHTKVGQDKAIDNELFEKYKRIILLHQINGFNDDKKFMPFHEPVIPENSEMIFSGEYFKAFQLNNNQ